MKTKPKVGQRVKLNDHGIEQIGGLQSQEAVKQSKWMLITYVGNDSLTNDCETYQIEVNQPLMNCFCLDNHCVDLIH